MAAAVTSSALPEPARPAPPRPQPRGDAPSAGSFADQLPERRPTRGSSDRGAPEKSARVEAGAEASQRPVSAEAPRRSAPAGQTGAETIAAAYAATPAPEAGNADQPAQASIPDAMIARLLAASRRAGEACAQDDAEAAEAAPEEETESANGETGAVTAQIVPVETRKAAAADASSAAAATESRSAAIGAGASHGRIIHPGASASPEGKDAAAPAGDAKARDVTPEAQSERKAAFAPADAPGAAAPAHPVAESVDPASDLARGLSFTSAGTAPPPAPPAVAPANLPTTPPTLIHMVPLAIGLKTIEGAREFSIRLDPDELGRVDVNLSISEDGRVEASLVVDRVETLALLQRDARTLERAFDQAGLTADSSSIRFSLRQDTASGQQQGGDHNDSGAAFQSARAVEPELTIDSSTTRIWRGSVGPAGIDIRV